MARGGVHSFFSSLLPTTDWFWLLVVRLYYWRSCPDVLVALQEINRLSCSCAPFQKFRPSFEACGSPLHGLLSHHFFPFRTPKQLFLRPLKPATEASSCLKVISLILEAIESFCFLKPLIAVTSRLQRFRKSFPEPSQPWHLQVLPANPPEASSRSLRTTTDSTSRSSHEILRLLLPEVSGSSESHHESTPSSQSGDSIHSTAVAAVMPRPTFSTCGTFSGTTGVSAAKWLRKFDFDMENYEDEEGRFPPATLPPPAIDTCLPNIPTRGFSKTLNPEAC